MQPMQPMQSKRPMAPVQPKTPVQPEMLVQPKTPVQPRQSMMAMVAMKPMGALYPLKLRPIYKEKIWGGDALARLFGRELPSQRVGESWEVAAHPHGQSIVSNGPLAGAALVDLLKSRRDEIMGKIPLVPAAGAAGADGAGDHERFPLLVKLLDCNDWLSVQVHPDDEYARTHEGELGKTESWVVLHAAPGAQIVYGLAPGTTRDEFAAAIAQNRVEEYLHKVEVRAGDVFSVPAGTVHALGRGVVVAEIQQNSDTVYRVYDWGRLGDDGKPRELHVEKALAVINFSFMPSGRVNRSPGEAGGVGDVRRTLLDRNDKYVIERIELPAGSEWAPALEERFFIYMVLAGCCHVAGGGEESCLRAGDSILVPASVTDLRLRAGAEREAPAYGRSEPGLEPESEPEPYPNPEPEPDPEHVSLAACDSAAAVVLLRAYVPDPI